MEEAQCLPGLNACSTKREGPEGVEKTWSGVPADAMKPQSSSSLTAVDGIKERALSD
jgi:hypothetical protein